MTNKNIDQIEHSTWDVIVIGTGVAGATLGYALAQQGKKVLFCEKGLSLLDKKQGLRQDFAEIFFPTPSAPSTKHDEILLKAGRNAELLDDESNTTIRQSIPFIGCGTGGSSSLYGYAMERLFPEDFSPRKHHTHSAAVSSSTLPEHWPISYDELAPYYEQAEQLYRVKGETDPCRKNEPRSLKPAPPFCLPNEELKELLSQQGFHPYRLPQACEFVPGCQGCQGFLCPKDCKNDSARICLKPALENHGATLLDECEVIRLEANSKQVTSIVCNYKGQRVTLQGENIVLAAGALATPQLLLKSASSEWPKGLANGSGLVGQNLMRHYTDIYAVLPTTRKDNPGNLKELAFNDLYYKDGNKFGTVQSFGALPPAEVIVEEMEHDLQQSTYAWLRPFFKLGKPFLRMVVKQLFKERVLFASIMEDLPYLENQVTLADDGQRIRLKYNIHADEQRRIKRFRKDIKKIFSSRSCILIKQAENNQRIAHACGTCRFGLTPEDSVINRTNRSHELSNLYIVDASFFPSSGGTNPALTLAANALRVADHMLSHTSSNPANI
ncbi:MAG: GMC family oxidoreductase [Gammaproteobacteria bacterium]|nr:GMC family oxidoreductase [Gammaproteobacteria bacterium]